jgi:hypothetical protein
VPIRDFVYASGKSFSKEVSHEGHPNGNRKGDANQQHYHGQSLLQTIFHHRAHAFPAFDDCIKPPWSQ